MGMISKLAKTEDGRKELFGYMTPEEKASLFGNLKAIEKTGEVLASCLDSYKEALEFGDFAYRTNVCWKLTKEGQEMLKLNDL